MASLLCTEEEEGGEGEAGEEAGGGEGGSTGQVCGVRLEGGEEVRADGVVLAAGHSAREMYEELVKRGAAVPRSDFEPDSPRASPEA